MIKSFYFSAIVVQLIWQVSIVSSQSRVPYNPCSEFFEYRNDGEHFIGVITLPYINFGTTNLNVQFSQHGPIPTNSIAQIEPFDSEAKIIQSIRKRQPVLYRVDFPNSRIPLQLKQIGVNGNIICSDLSSTIQLQHSLLTIDPNRNYDDQKSSNIDIRNYQQSSSFLPDDNRVHRPSGDNEDAAQKPSNNEQLNFNRGQKSNCGLADPRAFKQGGAQLDPGQIPWMAAIFKKKIDGPKFKCAGSLISQKTVITALLCLKPTKESPLTKSNEILVFLGLHNLRHLNAQYTVARNVKSIVISDKHESNSSTNTLDLDFRIAILHLELPVEFNQFIKPVCLWNEPEHKLQDFVGLLGYVPGWGAEETPNIIDATIVTEMDCLRSNAVFRHFIKNNTFCAGNKDSTGPCKGDGGSGLVINHNGRWTLRGLVAYGLYNDADCDLKQYIVYIDVAKDISWIKNNILL